MWKRGKRKYNEQKINIDGWRFDSKLEAAVYSTLKLMEKGGLIAELKPQPGTVFLSEARIQYRPDFRFKRVATGSTEWAEAKGFEGPRWPTQKKMWRTYGPGPLSIFRGHYSRPKLVEVITPKNAKPMGGVDELEGRNEGNGSDAERDEE